MIDLAKQSLRYLFRFLVIEPITSTAKLVLNMKPEQTNFTIQKILLDVIFKEIGIALAKNQVGGDGQIGARLLLFFPFVYDQLISYYIHIFFGHFVTT